MVAYFEIETGQIAELLAAQIKTSFGCQVTFTDPSQFEQSSTKGLPARQGSSGKKARKNLCQRATSSSPAPSTDRIAALIVFIPNTLAT